MCPAKVIQRMYVAQQDPAGQPMDARSLFAAPQRDTWRRRPDRYDGAAIGQSQRYW
jgi:hypothetical protein